MTATLSDIHALAAELQAAGLLTHELGEPDQRRARAVVLMARAVELGWEPLTGLAGLRIREDGSTHVDTGHLAALLRREGGRYSYDLVRRGRASVLVQMREVDPSKREHFWVRCEGGCLAHQRKSRAEACANCGHMDIWQTVIPQGWRWLGDVTATIERAREEGAQVDSEVWRKHPEGCLVARALREAARRFAPDVCPMGFGKADEETETSARALEGGAAEGWRKPPSESLALGGVRAEVRARSLGARGLPASDRVERLGSTGTPGEDLLRFRWRDGSWLAWRYSHRASQAAGGDERWIALAGGAWPSVPSDVMGVDPEEERAGLCQVHADRTRAACGCPSMASVLQPRHENGVRAAFADLREAVGNVYDTDEAIGKMRALRDAAPFCEAPGSTVESPARGGSGALAPLSRSPVSTTPPAAAVASGAPSPASAAGLGSPFMDYSRGVNGDTAAPATPVSPERQGGAPSTAGGAHGAHVGEATEAGATPPGPPASAAPASCPNEAAGAGGQPSPLPAAPPEVEEPPAQGPRRWVRLLRTVTEDVPELAVAKGRQLMVAEPGYYAAFSNPHGALSVELDLPGHGRELLGIKPDEFEDMGLVDDDLSRHLIKSDRDPRVDPLEGDVVAWGTLPEHVAEVLEVTAGPAQGGGKRHDLALRFGGGAPMERLRAMGLGAWRAKFRGEDGALSGWVIVRAEPAAPSYVDAVVALNGAAWDAMQLRAKHGDDSPIYQAARARTDAAREVLRQVGGEETGGPDEDPCPSCFGPLFGGRCPSEECDVDLASEWVPIDDRDGDEPDEPAPIDEGPTLNEAIKARGLTTRPSANGPGRFGRRDLMRGDQVVLADGTPIEMWEWLRAEPVLPGADPRPVLSDGIAAFNEAAQERAAATAQRDEEAQRRTRAAGWLARKRTRAKVPRGACVECGAPVLVKHDYRQGVSGDPSARRRGRDGAPTGIAHELCVMALSAGRDPKVTT